MLRQRQEMISISVPSGGTVDTSTREAVTGSTSVSYVIRVAWGSAPQSNLVIDRGSGRVMGSVINSDCSFVYEDHSDDALNLESLLVPGVVVTRAGRRYVPVGVSSYPSRALQVMSLRLLDSQGG